ncbi:MAG TPA: cbb3-type cytochrome c oxidase subunit I [Puia sp.]|nr:cbb3-type cytochrome c oxidase subunit I [Puia sp.]
MRRFDLISFLMNPRKWWLPLLLISVISAAGVIHIGMDTYAEAPPVPDFVSEKGQVIFSRAEILQGQAAFQKYALMEYGSMFGDGADRGPDFTADALHQTLLMMDTFYSSRVDRADRNAPLIRQGLLAQERNEIKTNRYDRAANRVILSEGQQYAASRLPVYYGAFFSGTGGSDFHPAGYIRDPGEIKPLSAFFFWGAWVCGVQRPGESYSYTHNWPYDPAAGNSPSSAVIFWSIIGSLGLVLGLGIVLYYHGKMDKLEDAVIANKSRPFMTTEEIRRFQPGRIQKVTYKFFYAAILLFATQVLAGILTVHDFVGLVHFFGFNISTVLPETVTRSWHVQLSLLWISACWMGASVFVMSMISPHQPKGQLALVNGVFWLTVLTVAGSFAGIFLGPRGLLATNWYWFGHQGWEYVELGKAWQILLFVTLVLWAVVLLRGVRPVMKGKQPWALPNWLVYATSSIILLLVSGFIATPSTNFVIADFWRWCVIHMWAEAFFEVFTTVLIGYFMVLMGLVSIQATIRVIYIATLLFLGSGLLGISHNFYWNAKPVGTMALGSVFSTLQVIPLVLLTLEAWRFSKMPRLMENNTTRNGSPGARFGFSEVFLFLLAVNFWNFLGAGVLGFIINLPIANYFEHGTYLTVNHGHAALMGVYGNLSLAAVLFCCQLLFKPAWWRPKTVRTIFWSINIGLLLMVLLDLFPVGIWQFRTVAEKGLWFARSSAFIGSTGFQTFTWLRILGGALFTLGGVVPLTWYVVRGRRQYSKSPGMPEEQAPVPVNGEPVWVS